MPPRPPALMEEHVEEILLRFSPQHPALLYRAALVCKRWRRLICSAGFRRRYREFHRTPPMLALLVSGEADSDSSSVTRFSAGAAFCLPTFQTRGWRVLDAHHGRVLLRRDGSGAAGGVVLLVFDPITKEPQMVPVPSPRVLCLAAAVLCSATTAAGACDHLDCHRGHFLLVFVGCLQLDRRTFIYTYSSETATWNGPISTELSTSSTHRMTSKCVGNALYFGFPMSDTILKYDLQSGQIARIEFPPECSFNQSNVFITTEGGGLGIATIYHSALHTWSRVDDAVGWMQTRAIELQRLLPGDALSWSAEPLVAGFVDPPFGIVLLLVNNWLYSVHLTTCKVVKLFRGMGVSINSVVPYMNFCTPALEATCTNEGPSARKS